MIAFNLYRQLEARELQTVTHSHYTNREFTYTYYIELVQKYRNRTLEDTEYYDFEFSMYKYDINRKA